MPSSGQLASTAPLMSSTVLAPDFGPAVGAAPEHGQVRDVRLEPVPRVERPGERRDLVRAGFVDLPAALADQVYVAGVAGQVVRGRAVVQVRVGDEAEAVQQLQRPVDGGDVDALGGLLHAGRDLFWRRVAQPGDRLEDQLALRG